MAIEHLKRENQELKDEISRLSSSFNEEVGLQSVCMPFDLQFRPLKKNDLLEKINEQERSHREERKGAADKFKKVEAQKEALERRLREAEDDVNRKVGKFVIISLNVLNPVRAAGNIRASRIISLFQCR